MVDFDKLYKGSWFTIIGAGGDLDEWKTGVQKLLDEEKIGEIQEWETFSGKDVNEFYSIPEDSSDHFPDDLTFLAFSLDGLNISKLAIFKLNFGARWFDDIVDNILRRMEEGD